MYKYLPYVAVIAMSFSSNVFAEEESNLDIKECPEGQIYDADLEECVDAPAEELKVEENLPQE